MTGQELVDELLKLEDLSLPVYTYNGDSGCGGEVCGASISERDAHDQGAFERLPPGTKVIKIYED